MCEMAELFGEPERNRGKNGDKEITSIGLGMVELPSQRVGGLKKEFGSLAVPSLPGSG